MELSHQGRAQLAAYGEALVGILTVDAALDIEQRIDPLHGLKSDRVDHAGMIAVALLAGCAGDVGQLKESAPRVGASSKGVGTRPGAVPSP